MTFPEVLPYLAAGKKVRRRGWHTALGHRLRPGIDKIEASDTDLLASDWEVVEEPSMPRSEGSNDGINWIGIPDGGNPMAYRYFRRTCLTGNGWGDDAETIAHLKRELADALRITSNLGVDKNEQCFAPTPSGGHRCLKGRGHDGGHANGGVSW